MGHAKQTLPFGGSTVVGVVVRTILDAPVEGVTVVTRSNLRHLLDLPSSQSITVLFNDDGSSEMIDSIRLGLNHLWNKFESAGGVNTQDGVLVIPGDMPTISPGTCRAVIETFRSDPTRIMIATHRGLRGHPLLLPMVLADAVRSHTGGLNELVQRHPGRVVSVPVDDPGVLKDLDSPRDYGDSQPAR